jgi:hypothetical protein
MVVVAVVMVQCSGSGGGMRAALLGLLRSFQDPAARYFDRTLKRP